MPLCTSINWKFKASFTAYKKKTKAFSYVWSLLCNEGGEYEEKKTLLFFFLTVLLHKMYNYMNEIKLSFISGACILKNYHLK